MKNTFKLPVITAVIAVIALFSMVSCEDSPPPDFTVTFNINGGSGTGPVSQTVKEGSSITLPGRNDLSKTGSTFGGWNTKADGTGTNYDAGSSYIVTGNITLYAKWEAPLGIIPSTALKAEPVATPLNKQVIDYFRVDDRHWYIIDAGFIKNTFISQLGSLHYNGITPMGLMITEVKEDTITKGVTSTVSDSVVFVNTTQTTKSISEEISMAITAGVTVGNTIGAGVGVGGEGWGVKANVESSLEASLELSHGVSIIQSEEISKTFSVSHEKSLATSIESIESFTHSLGNQLTFTIGEHNESAGWYRYALYAVSDVYFIVSTDLNNQNLLSWDIVSAVRQGDYLPHFEFSDNGRFDNAPTGNLIVFSEDFYKNLPKPNGYRLTTNVNIENSGTVVRTPKAINYTPGTKVIINAIPAPGYSFVNWTGTGAPAGTAANNADILITMNSDLTLTANFQPTYTVTFNANGASGTVPTTMTANTGSNITLPDKGNLTKLGYTFVGWNTNEAGTGTNYSAGFSYTVTDNITLYAKWDIVTYAVGDTGPAGGIIFYVKDSFSDGWQYLEAAPKATEFSAQWADKGGLLGGGTLIGGTSTGIGTGKQNTQLIVAKLGSIGNFAASKCDALVYNGYSDWFLPSRDELNLMYQNLYKGGLGEFINNSGDAGSYWSSSEVDANGAWDHNFHNGSPDNTFNSKTRTGPVRAVRAF